MIGYKWESYGIQRNEVLIQHPVLDRDFPRHCHDFTELVMVLSGEGNHLVGDQRYPLHRGDVYVITGDVAHGFDSPQKLSIVNVIFYPEEILMGEIRKEMKGYRALFEIEPIYRLENDFGARLTLTAAEMAEITGLVDEILSLTVRRTRENRILAKTLMNLMIARLSCYYDGRQSAAPRRILRLSSTIDYIEKNLSQPLDTGTLAALANFSIRHFNRLFMETFRITPKQYILNARMSLACRILRGTDLPVTEIAVQCGFGDSSYFSRIFLARYAMTPSRYRTLKTDSK